MRQRIVTLSLELPGWPRDHGREQTRAARRVLEMGEVLPFRERKPRVVQGAGARRRRATAS